MHPCGSKLYDCHQKPDPLLPDIINHLPSNIMETHVIDRLLRNWQHGTHRKCLIICGYSYMCKGKCNGIRHIQQRVIFKYMLTSACK